MTLVAPQRPGEIAEPWACEDPHCDYCEGPETD